MELLVGLVAQLLLVLMAPMLSICAAIAGLVFEFLVMILAAIFGGSFAVWRDARAQRAKPPELDRGPIQSTANEPTPNVRGGRRKVWRYGLLAVAMTVSVTVLVLNYLFFEPSLRWVANLAASRMGYELELDVVEGDLIAGELRFEGLSLKGENADGTQADLTVALFEADMSVLSLLSSTVRIHHLRVDDIDLDVIGASSQAADGSSDGSSGRNFVVERLDLTDANMTVQQPDGTTHFASIDTARAEPLRSRVAIFDLLFRSTVEAAFDGTKLRVDTQIIDGNGRRTEWELGRISLTTLAAFVDAPIVRWFEAGTLSAQMQDEWRRDDVSIDSEWRITLRDAEVGLTRVGGITEAIFAKSLAEVVEVERGDIDLGFRLQLDESGFRDWASGDLSAWWDAMIKGVAIAVAEYQGVTSDDAEGRLRGITDGVRGILGIEREGE